jgi:hypothetical protein
MSDRDEDEDDEDDEDEEEEEDGDGGDFTRRRGWCRARGASARSTSSRWTRPHMRTLSARTVEPSPRLAKGHSEHDMDERGADTRDTGSALERARINDAESTRT